MRAGGVILQFDGAVRRILKGWDEGTDGVLDQFAHFFLAGQQVIETRQGEDQSGEPPAAESLNPKHQFVWSARYIDALILRDENTDGDATCTDADDKRLFYLADANYNVTAVVAFNDQTETWHVAERYVYDPYGKATVLNGDPTVDPDGQGSPSTYPEWSVDPGPDGQQGTADDGTTSDVANTTLFTGRELDPETGVYYYRQRIYHPTLAGFLTRDPLGYAAGDANLYRYCANDPVGALDPYGLQELDPGDQAVRDALNRAVGGFDVPQPQAFDSAQLIRNVPLQALKQILGSMRQRVHVDYRDDAYAATRKVMHAQGVRFEDDLALLRTVDWMIDVKEASGGRDLPSGWAEYPGTWINDKFFVYCREEGFGIIDDARLATSSEMVEMYAGMRHPPGGGYRNNAGTIRWQEEFRGDEWKVLQTLWAPPDQQGGFLFAFQTFLDFAGVIPFLGEAADVTNALIYAYHGQWADCTLSLMGIVPGLGDLYKAGGRIMLKAGGGVAVVAGTYLSKGEKIADSASSLRASLLARNTTRLNEAVEGMQDIARARGLRSAAIHRHHPLPKFFGGHAKQVLTELDERIHVEFHAILRANLGDAGIPLNVGGRGGSAVDWADYFTTHPGAQATAFDAVLDAARSIDQRYGTNAVHDVWENILKGSFRAYP